MNNKAITDFLHTQIKAWNAGDRDGFMKAYRSAAPKGLQIEYVGKASTDGWPVLEGMWSQQSSKIEIEELALIVNGNEVACHNLNKVRGTTVAIETIELYRFEEGHLSIRYFVGQP